MNPSTPSTGGTASDHAAGNRSYYPALDGLRALAFIGVFLLHYGFLSWGGAGVNVFFVLSGFLITGILWDTRHRPHRAQSFYMRRILRIFPLYYGAMLVLLLSWPLLHWHFTIGWLLWPAYLGNFTCLRFHAPGSALQDLAYFQPVGLWHGHAIRLFFGHFWTLCIEEQFYLVWPWAVFFFRRRTLLTICALSLPLCLLLRVAALHWLPPWLVQQGFLTLFTPLTLDALLLGALLALLLRGSHGATTLRFAQILFPVALALLLLWGCVNAVVPQARVALPMPQALSPTLFNFAAALVLLVALQPDTWLARALSLRPLRWVGRISYGAYVFHDIPHLLYAHLATHLPSHQRSAAIAAFGFAATLALAALSFRFFESPFLALKHRFTPTSHT